MIVGFFFYRVVFYLVKGDISKNTSQLFLIPGFYFSETSWAYEFGVFWVFLSNKTTSSSELMRWLLAPSLRVATGGEPV